LHLPLTGDPEEYRTMSRAEVCEWRGLKEAELRGELEVIRAAWRKNTQTPKHPNKPELRNSEKEPGSKLQTPNDQTPKTDSALPTSHFSLESDDDLLRKHGFGPEMFKIPGLTAEDVRVEKSFLAARGREWEKILAAPSTKRLAHQALLHEFGLRRMQARKWQLESLTYESSTEEARRQKELAGLEKRISQNEETYQSQLTQLQEMAPWWNVTGKQMTMSGSIGDLIKGIQEYQANGSNALADGINTLAEIQLQMRQSQQQPEPDYRLGLVTYWNEAKAGLWSQEWKPKRTPAELKVMDEGGRELIKRLNEVSQAHIPDLEDMGPQGEFTDIPE
jgi:hypothetical protein